MLLTYTVQVLTVTIIFLQCIKSGALKKAGPRTNPELEREFYSLNGRGTRLCGFIATKTQLFSSAADSHFAIMDPIPLFKKKRNHDLKKDKIFLH